jgi:hypothetical protein
VDLINNRLWRLLSNENYGGSENTLGWIDLNDPMVRGRAGPQTTYQFGGTFPPLKFLPGLGASGSLIAMQSNSTVPASFQRFDIATLTWSTLTAFVTYEQPAAVEYGGSIYWSASAQDAHRGFYRMGPSMTRETLATPPIPMNADAYTGTPYNAELAAVGGKIYAFSNLTDYAGVGGIYVYDIATDTWGATPIDTAFPHLPDWTGQNLTTFTITGVESEGVVLMARQKDASSTIETFVWKP